MIIFDLDGVLADDSHRRHFINQHTELGEFDPDLKPDYPDYYEACDKDQPIRPIPYTYPQNMHKKRGNFDIRILWNLMN